MGKKEESQQMMTRSIAHFYFLSVVRAYVPCTVVGIRPQYERHQDYLGVAKFVCISTALRRIGFGYQETDRRHVW